MSSPNDAANETVVLAKVPTEVEAELIVGDLNDQGIDAQHAGGHTAGFRAEAPGMVSILVHKSDRAKAHAALMGYRERQKEIDWSKVDVGDPE